MAKGKLEKVGALWTNTNGKKTYFNLEIEGKKYVGFSNDYKENDKQPDFIVYKSRPKTK